MVFAQKCFGNRVRISKGRDGLGCNCAFRAFFIHDNPDDRHVIWRIELLEHFLAVGHLGHGFRGNKAHRVNVLETGVDKCAQILHLNFGRDLPLEALPGVTRTFDQFDWITRHS